jgi:hypothetical protein
MFLDCRHMAEVQESVTAVLRSIPKQTFAESFQKLYERFQQCVVMDGDYFEANKVNLFVSSVLFVFWYHSPNFLDTPHMFLDGVIYESINLIKKRTRP